jgi:hypothetical protein
MHGDALEVWEAHANTPPVVKNPVWFDVTHVSGKTDIIWYTSRDE